MTWFLDNTIIDESFERSDGVTVNHLLFPNLGRQHLNARLFCMASNTHLTPPNSKVVILDIYRKCLIQSLIIIINSPSPSFPVKPVAVHIITKEKFVIAGKPYEVECKSSGSRPEGVITWWKGGRQIKRMAKSVRGRS